MVWLTVLFACAIGIAGTLAFAGFKEDNKPLGAAFTAAALILIALTIFTGSSVGPKDDSANFFVRTGEDLQPGVIYEIVNKVGKGGSKHYIVLRDEIGRKALYELDKEPPPKFFLRATQDGKVEIFSTSANP